MHSSAGPSRPCTRPCERPAILSAPRGQRLCHPRTHDTEGDDHIRGPSSAATLRPDPCPCGRADARRGVRVPAPVDPPGCAGSSRSCARRVPRGSSTATAAGGRRTGWRTGSPSGWWSLPGPPMPASTRSTSPSAWQRIRRRRSTSRPGPSGGSSPPPRSPRRGRHAANPSDVARAPARARRGRIGRERRARRGRGSTNGPAARGLEAWPAARGSTNRPAARGSTNRPAARGLEAWTGVDPGSDTPPILLLRGLQLTAGVGPTNHVCGLVAGPPGRIRRLICPICCVTGSKRALELDRGRFGRLRARRTPDLVHPAQRFGGVAAAIGRPARLVTRGPARGQAPLPNDSESASTNSSGLTTRT